MSDFLPELDFSAGIAARVQIGDTDEVHHRTSAHRAAFIERLTPRLIKLPVGIQVPATGAAFQFVADLPSLGRRLEIRRFHLDLAQPLTAAGVPVVEPTTLTVFLVADPGGALSIPNFTSAAVLRRYTTLPIDDTYSKQSVIATYPENLWVVVSNNAGVAVSLAGNIQVTDMASNQFSETAVEDFLSLSVSG